MDQTGGYDQYTFVAEFYDHVVPYRQRQDVAFFVDMAHHTTPPVLELGCGTGRVLLPTARAGIEVTGLDLSSAMLARCRQKLAREPRDVQARVRLVQGDMRRFDLGRSFGLVTVPFRAFLHLLTVTEQLACLRSMHRHLTSEGRLILDVFNPSLARLVDPRYLAEYGAEPSFTMPDGRTVIRRHRVVAYDLYQQVMDGEFLYDVTHPDGRQERLVHRIQLRYLFRFEAEHLLARTGFQVETVYADYDKSPYGSTYPGELIMVARPA
jgi:SAM-dependent methyltransferase